MVFFFQAEDGIRDTSVTGVQTCALPISRPPTCSASDVWRVPFLQTLLHNRYGGGSGGARKSQGCIRFRSEERRVGKECRARWGPDRREKGTKQHTHVGATVDVSRSDYRV